MSKVMIEISDNSESIFTILSKLQKALYQEDKDAYEGRIREIHTRLMTSSSHKESVSIIEEYAKLI